MRKLQQLRELSICFYSNNLMVEGGSRRWWWFQDLFKLSRGSDWQSSLALNNEHGERNQGSFYIIQRLDLYSLAEGTEGRVGCEPWGPKSRTLIRGVVTCRTSTVFVSLVAVAQLLGRVRLSAAPWTAMHQAPLSFTISQSLRKLMSVESVMPPSHLILCHPLVLLTEAKSVSGDLYTCCAACSYVGEGEHHANPFQRKQQSLASRSSLVALPGQVFMAKVLMADSLWEKWLIF